MADNQHFIDRERVLPKFKIRVRGNERIKMTFIVDECRGVYGAAGRETKAGVLDWQDWGFNGSNAEKDPGLQYT